MEQILTATQTTGGAFKAPGWVTVFELVGYVSGTWKIQVRGSDGTWYDVASATFTGDDLLYVRTLPLREYRITGGAAGPTAYAGEWLGES